MDDKDQGAAVGNDTGRSATETASGLSKERISRCNQFVDVLNRPLGVVLFFEKWGSHPDGGGWLVQSQQIDYCAQGKTKDQAFDAFRWGLLSTLALNCDPRFKWPEPCPKKEWDNIIRTMEGVEFYQMQLTFSPVGTGNPASHGISGSVPSAAPDKPLSDPSAED